MCIFRNICSKEEGCDSGTETSSANVYFKGRLEVLHSITAYSELFIITVDWYLIN
jgi:hypothetical protein